MESCRELGSTKYWMNDDEGKGNELASSTIHGLEGSGECMVESRFTFSRSLVGRAVYTVLVCIHATSRFLRPSTS